jgi:hypothetical protein
MTNPHSTTQAQLTEITYDGHLHADPPAKRVTATITSSDDFYATREGDVLWIDSTEFVVLTKQFGFVHQPLTVVAADGTQGSLIGGAISHESSTTGVLWTTDISDTDDVQRSDLLASFDHVYRLERDDLERVHAWTPDTDQRMCPACEYDRSGEPLRIERQANHAVELRQCTNTDCKHAYRFIRPFPEPETATLYTWDGRTDTLDEHTIHGVYRCTEQDDFKFPIKTNDGRDDGFWTASEVADFLNPKLDHDDPAERFGTVTVTTTEYADQQVIRWQDDLKHRAKMTVEFHAITAPTPRYDRALRWLNKPAYRAILPE